MTMVAGNHGYNIGLELTQCYAKYFDHHENELNGLINQLQMTNIQIKMVSDVMNKLSHAKQDKKADLNNDEMAKKCAYLIHLRNPTIFEDKIHGVPEGITFDQQLQEIVDQLKQDGLSQLELNLGAILSKVDIGNMKIDVLSEEDIDIVIQGLDGETKMLTTDLNQIMMNINKDYEDRSQMTENARQVLKESNDHNISIIHKTTGR
jgi:hypothetical protein